MIDDDPKEAQIHRLNSVLDKLRARISEQQSIIDKQAAELDSLRLKAGRTKRSITELNDRVYTFKRALIDAGLTVPRSTKVLRP